MMRNKRIIVLLIFVVVVLSIFAACSNNEAPENKEDSNANKGNMTLSIGTGGSGGTYYSVGSGIGQLVEKYMDGTKMVVQATAASTENIRLVGTKKLGFAFNMPDSAYFAIIGEREFEQSREKYENIKGILSGHVSVIQAFVSAKSDINSYADLKGKRVALSAPSSPSMYVAMAVLESYGLKEGDYEAYFMSYAEMSEGVRNGSIDCGFGFGGVPIAAALDLTSSYDTRILGMEQANVDYVTENYPYFSAGMIAANTYKGQEEELLSISAPAIIITHDDMDEETVYNLTKTIWENIEELRKVHPACDEWILEKAVDGIGIPLHPGAERYYKEVGVLK